MGKIVHLDKVRAFVQTTPAFRARDVQLLVGDRGYALQLLHNLARRGEVRRVTKGWYSSHDDPVVSVFAFKPAYLGLQEALSLRGISEQETNVVLVTPRKVRPGIRTVMGANVLVRRIEKKRFFGFDYVKYDDFFVPVSDIEKTLIDLVYYGEAPDSRIVAEAKGRVDSRKMDGYLRSYPIDFKRRMRSILIQAKVREGMA